MIFALCVLVGSMVLSRNLPFRFARNNMLQFYASLVSFKTLFWGVFFYAGRLTESQSAAVTAMCILGWVFVLGFVVHGIFYEYLAYFTTRIVQNRPWAKCLLLNKCATLIPPHNAVIDH